jgi:transcriptional regulator with XRE-family HTH domain
MPYFMSLFARNLRFLRKKGNHNQEEIAILFNKQANTIGNWENRKSEPNLQELIQLGEFFKVRTEDLLQTDIEGQAKGSTSSLTERSFTQAVSSSSQPQQTGSSMNSETGPDAFWLILRELRAVHEKVDLLIADRESSGAKRNSDKSYH